MNAETAIRDMEGPLIEMRCVVSLLRGLVGSVHQIESDMLVPIANELDRLHGNLAASRQEAFDAAVGKSGADR